MTTQTKQEKTLFTHLYDILASGDYGTYIKDYIDLSADHFLNDEQKKYLDGKVKVYINSQPTEEDLKYSRKEVVPKDFTEKDERKIREKAKTSIKKFEDITEPLSSLLDFIIVEKAPFGFKPLGSLFGGGGDKPSGGEDEEKVPEGNRVYVDSKEEAPEGVEVLTGRRGGFFYDMTSLTSDDHGDEITDVFNNLMDELTEAQTPEAIEGRAKELKDMQDKMFAIEADFKKNHPKAEELNKAEADFTARQRQIIEDGQNAGDAFDKTIATLESDEKLNSLKSKRDELNNKIDRDAAEAMAEDKDYQSLKEERKAGIGDPTIAKLKSKLGNALIHSFKSSPFKVDDMTFKIDPNLKYDDSPSGWDKHISGKVSKELKGMIEGLPEEDKQRLVPDWEEVEEETEATLDDQVVQHFLGAETAVNMMGDLVADPSIIEKAAEVQKIRKDINDSSYGVFDGETNAFKASPEIWAKVSKMGESGIISPDMKKALHVVVHESLHSMNHDERHEAGLKHIAGREKGLAKEGISMNESYQNMHTFMEEGPVELLSQSIMGRKYNKDLVGKDVFTDKAFTEGAGNLKNHEAAGYQDTLPHLARWSLAYSGGSPKRARALLGKMREVGAGQGEVDAQGNPNQAGVVDNHRLTNQYTASYGQYLKDYADQHKNTIHGDSASRIGRGLSEGQDLKYGDNKLPNISLRPEIRDSKPAHDDDGNISEAGHLDIMHLIYGEG